MKCKKILDFLNEKYPLSEALSFDNVGLLVGDENAEVSGVVVTLDCDIDTIKFAIKNGCNLIISHHPVIFDPLNRVTAGSVVHELIKNGISVISMHTNLDFYENGVNDCLCSLLGFTVTDIIEADDGCKLRKCSIPPTAPQNLAVKLKAALGTSVRYTDSDRLIENLLVCAGSGGNFLELAESIGCDALLTADVKHHVFINSINNGLSVFDAGHFATEDVITAPLSKLLSSKFYDVKFLPFHTNKIKYC